MCFLAILTSALALAAPPDPVATLGRAAGAEDVFYRWQSTVSGKNLAREGRMTSALDRHFMKHSGVGGPGFYVAASPTSSVSYLPDHGGTLVEIHVVPGVRLIDLTDPGTVERMAAAHLGPHDLLSGTVKTPVLVKYLGDWFVGKNLAERAEFKMYPGPARTAAEVARALDALEFKALDAEKGVQAAGQIVRQMIAHRPDLVGEVAVATDLSPAVMRELGSDSARAALTRAAAVGLTPRAADNLLAHFARSAAALDDLAANPALHQKIADEVVAHVTRLSNVPPAHFDALVALATRAIGDPHARETRVEALVARALDDAVLWRRAEFATARLAPLLAATPPSPALSAAIRARVATYRASKEGCLDLIETLASESGGQR